MLIDRIAGPIRSSLGVLSGAEAVKLTQLVSTEVESTDDEHRVRT